MLSAASKKFAKVLLSSSKTALLNKVKLPAFSAKSKVKSIACKTISSAKRPHHASV